MERKKAAGESKKIHTSANNGDFFLFSSKKDDVKTFIKETKISMPSANVLEVTWKIKLGSKDAEWRNS